MSFVIQRVPRVSERLRENGVSNAYARRQGPVTDGPVFPSDHACQASQEHSERLTKAGRTGIPHISRRHWLHSLCN